MQVKHGNIIKNSAADFEQLYVDNYHKIRSFCNHYLRDDDMSKSVAQDVFVSIWNNREALQFTNELLPYLFVLAKNSCLNILLREKVKRKHSEHGKRVQRDALNFSSLKESSVTNLYGKEVEGIIKNAFENMPDTVRATFCLSRFKNLKYEEIAIKQDISIKTVEYRIMYALRILRKFLKDYLPVMLGFIVTNLY
jgi:RNA polymerase sigma-70 factor (ECF subfamily)